VECCLHADHPVDGAVGDRQPDGVADHRRGRGLPQMVPARRQLPLGDVHRYQPPGADRLGDQRVLGCEPVAHIEDGSPGRQSQRERPHHPAAGGLSLAPGTGSLPQPQVQPARRQRQEAVRPDALVDPRGGVPVLLDHRGGMPRVLHRPAHHRARCRCHPCNHSVRFTRAARMAGMSPERGSSPPRDRLPGRSPRGLPGSLHARPGSQRPWVARAARNS